MNRRKQNGSAIVELALAMLLMISILLFILLIGRFLSERNRTLAASRTLAWVVAHYQEGGGDTPTGGNMHRLIRKWHFKESGPAAGVVSLPEPRVGNGLIYRDARGEENIRNLGQSLMGTLDASPEAQLAGTADDLEMEEDPGGDTLGSFFNQITNQFFEGFVNVLTRDFEYYEARIEYGMPLVFPRKAYEMFWGETFGDPEGPGNNPHALGMYDAGETYLFIDPGYAGTTVFPSLNANVDNAFADLTVTMASWLERLQELMKREDRPAVLRPYTIAGDGLEALLDAQSILGSYGKSVNLDIPPSDRSSLQTARRLEALMVYELPGYDPRHAYAIHKAEQSVRLENADFWGYFTNQFFSP